MKTKIKPTILVFGLACLLALSTALPSMISQIASTQAKPNASRTLLGRPYRTRWDVQGCPPSRWTLAVTDPNDPDADTEPDHAPAHQASVGSGAWIQTKTDKKPHVPIPLPLVVNTFPESGPARVRLLKSRRPMQHSPCSDDVLLSGKTRSEGMNPRDEDVQHVQSPVISVPMHETKQLLRKSSRSIRRPKRLYDRGEWKSRLFEEY